VTRSEELVADALALLHAHGFVPDVSMGRHIKIRWLDAGRRYTLVISRSPGTSYARQQSKATLRRLLRAEECVMSQRISGYHRRIDDHYPTPAWGVAAMALALRPPVTMAWDIAEDGSGHFISVLQQLGVPAIGTSEDFFTFTAPPLMTIDAIVVNPPYREAVGFIEHALQLGVRQVAVLLRVDFDSGSTRQHLFRRERRFAGKVVLLHRLKWFDGESNPSDNHAIYLWDLEHEGAPTLSYLTRPEAEAHLARRGR
jgi:hypothetical protein